jgi:hypothetical protein
MLDDFLADTNTGHDETLERLRRLGPGAVSQLLVSKGPLRPFRGTAVAAS